LVDVISREFFGTRQATRSDSSVDVEPRGMLSQRHIVITIVALENRSPLLWLAEGVGFEPTVPKTAISEPLKSGFAR
jgi:hypothetical protein